MGTYKDEKMLIEAEDNMHLELENEELKEENKILKEALREVRYKLSKSALERGKLLQRLEKYEPSDEPPEFTYRKHTKEELRAKAEAFAWKRRGGDPDATGIPAIPEDA